MKTPFDVKYRPQIESGKYKVQTNDGSDVRIVCWDAEGSKRKDDIVALVKGTLGAENIQRYYVSRKLIADSGRRRNKDLVVVTPEPELTEFERRIKDLLAIKCEIFYNEDIGGCYDLKGLCSAILECAREQLRPEIDAEIAKAYKNADSIVYENGVLYGKAEALKDLQRSEDKEATIKVGDRVLIHCKTTRHKTLKHIYDNQEGEVLHVWDLKGNPWGNIHVRIEGGYNDGFLLEELEKLPKFKEE